MAEKAEEPKKSEAEELLDMVNDPNFDWAGWDGVGMIPHTQTQLEAALGLVHTDIAKQPNRHRKTADRTHPEDQVIRI